MKKILLSLLSLSIFLSLINLTNAATPLFSLTSVHNKVDFQVTPGSIIKDSVVVQNLDKEENITIKLRSSFPDKWIRFEKTIIDLKPDTNEAINYTVTIPTILEDDDTIKKEYNIYASLENWDTKGSSGGIQISLEIGRSYYYKFLSGPPFALDYRMSATKEPLIQEIENGKIILSDISNQIFTFADKHKKELTIIVLLLILIKLTLNRRRKEKNSTKIKTNKKAVTNKTNTKKKTTKTITNKANTKKKTTKAAANKANTKKKTTKAVANKTNTKKKTTK